MPVVGKNLDPNCPSSKQMLMEFISDLIGEDRQKLEALSSNQLLALVGVLLKSDKQKLEEMFVNYHDEGHSLNAGMINDLWKFINKGLLKRLKKNFGSMSNDLYEQIKSQLAGEIRKMSEVSTSKAKISTINLQNIMGCIVSKVEGTAMEIKGRGVGNFS